MKKAQHAASMLGLGETKGSRVTWGPEVTVLMGRRVRGVGHWAGYLGDQQDGTGGSTGLDDCRASVVRRSLA